MDQKNEISDDYDVKSQETLRKEREIELESSKGKERDENITMLKEDREQDVINRDNEDEDRELSNFITALYIIILKGTNKTITEVDPDKYRVPATYINSIIEGIVPTIKSSKISYKDSQLVFRAIILKAGVQKLT